MGQPQGHMAPPQGHMAPAQDLPQLQRVLHSSQQCAQQRNFHASAQPARPVMFDCPEQQQPSAPPILLDRCIRRPSQSPQLPATVPATAAEHALPVVLPAPGGSMSNLAQPSALSPAASTACLGQDSFGNLPAATLHAQAVNPQADAPAASSAGHVYQIAASSSPSFNALLQTLEQGQSDNLAEQQATVNTPASAGCESLPAHLSRLHADQPPAQAVLHGSAYPQHDASHVGSFTENTLHPGGVFTDHGSASFRQVAATAVGPAACLTNQGNMPVPTQQQDRLPGSHIDVVHAIAQPEACVASPAAVPLLQHSGFEASPGQEQPSQGSFRFHAAAPLDQALAQGTPVLPRQVLQSYDNPGL